MDRQRSKQMKMCINICLPLCGNNTLLITSHLRSKNNKIVNQSDLFITLLVRILSSKTIREETHPGSRFWVYCCQYVIQSYCRLFCFPTCCAYCLILLEYLYFSFSFVTFHFHLLSIFSTLFDGTKFLYNYGLWEARQG
jgi:hypothetical protein